MSPSFTGTPSDPFQEKVETAAEALKAAAASSHEFSEEASAALASVTTELTKLAEFRMTTQATYEPKAQLVGPDATFTIDEVSPDFFADSIMCGMACRHARSTPFTLMSSVV